MSLKSTNAKVTVTKYEGGTNAVIEANGKAVSVSKSDSGLWGVATARDYSDIVTTDEKTVVKYIKDYLKE